jgi:hypothetical protein
MADCCISSGGVARLRVEGVVYPLRGSITLTAVDREATADANIDGSTFITSKPVPPMVEMTLSDTCGLSLYDLTKVRCVDVVLEMPEVGRTIVLVNGALVGKPQLDPATGEISGVSFVGSSIREILDAPS